jgi:Protein of unknown function (DUF2510)/Phospholipase_D-nuclease N-terminal
MIDVGFHVIPLLFLLLWAAASVYWIVAIIEVARTPDVQFRAVASDKVGWLLIVILTGIVGALIWLFAKRSAVLGAAGRAAPPPPGWYPEQAPGSYRWWDGVRWTEARHSAPPPAPPTS